MEVGVAEGLARLCCEGQTGRDRSLRLAELAGGSLCFGQKRKESGRTRLASRLGGDRHAVQDLWEPVGNARRNVGRSVICAAKSEKQGEALRLAQRDHVRRTLAL